MLPTDNCPLTSYLVAPGQGIAPTNLAVKGQLFPASNAGLQIPHEPSAPASCQRQLRQHTVPGGRGPAVSRASLQADLAAADTRTARLAAQVRRLEARLSEALGEQVWRESGIGGPDDTEQLKARITTLEQQVVDLELTLQERDEDLAAARAANRELMAQLNRGRDTPLLPG